MPCFNLVLRRPDELLKHNFLDKSRHCGRLGFLGWSRHHPPSCVPFAPSPLRDFLATTDALTPAGLSPTTGQVSLILAHELPIPPSPNTQDASRRRFRTLPLSSTGLPLAQVKTSPLGGRLVSRSGRIEFVILRMDRSPPVASHPVLRRRSYSWLQAGERIPEEDFHLSDQTRFQAHSGRTAGPSAARSQSLSNHALFCNRDLIRYQAHRVFTQGSIPHSSHFGTLWRRCLRYNRLQGR
jgi:hypothetical protein